MILAFSGTRRGLTAYQRRNLVTCLAALPERLFHGGAVGADEEVDALLAPLYWESERRRGAILDPPEGIEYPIVVYPASIERRRYWTRDVRFSAVREIEDPRPPLDRNRIIARCADRLLAAPATLTEILRSGTWATVRYAHAAGRPVTILLPWPVPWSETGIVEELDR